MHITNNKPSAVIQKIIDACTCASKKIIVNENEVIHFNNKNNECYFLTSGEVTIRKSGTGKMITRIKSPYIFGFNYYPDSYIHTFSDAEFFVISTNKAIDIIETKKLWKDMYYIANWHANRCYTMVHILNQKSSKMIIINLLKKLYLEPIEYRYTITALQYVQENASLSRSCIYNTLAELSSEGTIFIRRGILISMHNL
ncbi:TPA: helix-turn-helix domain-containing protein [Citrobacter gillenii]